MIREITIKYSDEIEVLVKRLRRWTTELDHEPCEQELWNRTENEFFLSEIAGTAEISEIRILIQCVYARLISRYGILLESLCDPKVNEIMVNGPHRIFVERNGQIEELDNAFTSCEELEEIIRMFASDVHREVNEANPIVDARMPSGYRINGVMKTVALNGPILTIRKFRESEISMQDLIAFGSINEACANDLITLVRCGYNIFISGGTSSGKTTFLNALSASIDNRERVIVIEDSAELMLSHLNNCVHMECRSANSIGKGEISMRKLIKTSLRMRPDRIIVGEVRGREVIDMIQAMNTGHDGSMSTGHGNSVEGMLNRLETMYMSDGQMPISSVRNQIANAVDIFIHLRRDTEGKRKVEEVAELTGTDGENYELNYLYLPDENGVLARTGNPLRDRERLNRAGCGAILS